MNATPGTPEAAELVWLSGIVASVEEYGEEACEDESLLPLPTPDGTVEAIGPRPHILVCKGCPAYETEKWREPSGDGETYDTGQYAWCNAADHKSMGAYHYDHDSAPKWCPALQALKGGK